MVFTELGVLHSQIRILPTSLVNIDPKPGTEADLNWGQLPKAQRFKPTSQFSLSQEKEDSQRLKMNSIQHEIWSLRWESDRIPFWKKKW